MADEPLVCDAEGCTHDPFVGLPGDVAMRYVIHLKDRHPREWIAKRNAAIRRGLEEQGLIRTKKEEGT